jgi:putative membrane protein
MFVPAVAFQRIISDGFYSLIERPGFGHQMAKILAHWVLSALCILVVARFVPGFFVRGFGTALIAAVVIGLVNGTIGLFLKFVTLPLTILTFGLFWFLINALMLKLAALFVPASKYAACGPLSGEA